MTGVSQIDHSYRNQLSEMEKEPRFQTIKKSSRVQKINEIYLPSPST